jgi:hypothetical protein
MSCIPTYGNLFASPSTCDAGIRSPVSGSRGGGRDLRKRHVSLARRVVLHVLREPGGRHTRRPVSSLRQPDGPPCAEDVQR